MLAVPLSPVYETFVIIKEFRLAGIISRFYSDAELILTLSVAYFFRAQSNFA
jgi:hypothetical protein